MLVFSLFVLVVGNRANNITIIICFTIYTATYGNQSSGRLIEVFVSRRAEKGNRHTDGYCQISEQRYWRNKNSTVFSFCSEHRSVVLKVSFALILATVNNSHSNAIPTRGHHYLCVFFMILYHPNISTTRGVEAFPVTVPRNSA